MTVGVVGVQGKGRSRGAGRSGRHLMVHDWAQSRGVGIIVGRLPKAMTIKSFSDALPLALGSEIEKLSAT